MLQVWLVGLPVYFAGGCEHVLFIDYDSSVGNMCAVVASKPTHMLTPGNLPNIVSILGEHLHSWYNIEMTLQGCFDLQTARI